MTEKVPGWLERVLLPRLSEMAGEIKAVNVRIEALDEKLSTKIDGVDNRLAAKIDGVDNRLAAKIDDLDKRLDMAQRLAVLEAKMSELHPGRRRGGSRGRVGLSSDPGTMPRVEGVFRLSLQWRLSYRFI